MAPDDLERESRERTAGRAPAEQRTIRQIVRLRRSGATFQAIADRLDRAGTPSKRGASWHPMTVARVVQHAAASHKRSNT